ncbi:unnamed protein product [Blepharisma stoltei]|uniref:Uncharacterized protein n=1 Tax=Blepharisma stoltei TaxID=1481888 RepID=A0AAU9JC63_9CILI|nr:unnamed protein product [Blepharisma stoltei]
MIQKQILSKFLMRKSFLQLSVKIYFSKFIKKADQKKKKEVFVKFCTVLNENFPPNTDNSSRFEKEKLEFYGLRPNESYEKKRKL